MKCLCKFYEGDDPRDCIWCGEFSEVGRDGGSFWYWLLFIGLLAFWVAVYSWVLI